MLAPTSAPNRVEIAEKPLLRTRMQKKGEQHKQRKYGPRKPHFPYFCAIANKQDWEKNGEC